MLHKASSYYISIQADIEMSSIVLNYTMFINESISGQPLGIFLSISNTSEIFTFASGDRTRNYLPSIFLPNEYNVKNSVSSFQESVYISAALPEKFFRNNTANFILELPSTVLLSLSSTAEYSSIINVTIYRLRTSKL